MKKSTYVVFKGQVKGSVDQIGLNFAIKYVVTS